MKITTQKIGNTVIQSISACLLSAIGYVTQEGNASCAADRGGAETDFYDLYADSCGCLPFKCDSVFYL